MLNAENSNRGQQFQHSRKDSQEQHSFRNHHHVFSKEFFVYPSLFHYYRFKIINKSVLVVNFKFFQVYLSQSHQILPKSFYLGSILRLVKIIQSKLPKKVKRDPIEHANHRFGQLPNNKIIQKNACIDY